MRRRSSSPCLDHALSWRLALLLHTLGAGSFFRCLAALLGLLLDVSCQPAGPVLSFVPAVTVCPRKFPLDYCDLVCGLGSSSDATLICFHRCGFCLLGLVSSAFEERSHHAVPRQHAVSSVAKCSNQAQSLRFCATKAWEATSASRPS